MRAILERFQTNGDSRLSAEGFLQYQADQAWHNPKSVWKDLHAFGYRNDLTRNKNANISISEKSNRGMETFPRSVSDNSDSSAVSSTNDGLNMSSNPNTPTTNALPTHTTNSSNPQQIISDFNISLGTALPHICRMTLLNYSLYEAGMETSEAATSAIAKKVVTDSPQLSIHLIRQALVRLHRLATESAWGTSLNSITDFLQLLLSVQVNGQLYCQEWNKIRKDLFTQFCY